MNDMMKILAETDAATLRLERARRALETAKANLESAKQVYDEILGRSDEMGISRAKLKKIADERVFALIESGMIEIEKSSGDTRPNDARPERPKSRTKAKPSHHEGSDSLESRIDPSSRVVESQVHETNPSPSPEPLL